MAEKGLGPQLLFSQKCSSETFSGLRARPSGADRVGKKMIKMLISICLDKFATKIARPTPVQ